VINFNKKKRTLVQKSVVEHTQMTRIPTSDLQNGYKELTANAFKLLTYYYSKSDGWEFDDKEIARAFGLNGDRTIGTLRKELVDKGYLLFYKGIVDNYFVGKKRVEEFKQ
jgi:hypothetical protein